MKFEKNDIVKGDGRIPFDIDGHSYVVEKVENNKIGKPCWLKRLGTGRYYPYSISSDILILVKRPSKNVLERRVEELEERMQELENKLRKA